MLSADLPGWSRPLRVYLAAIMAGLLIGVSGLIAALNFMSGRAAAIDLASDQMRVLSERIVEHYRILSADSVMFVEFAAISDEFLSQPSERLRSKLEYLRLAVNRVPHVDGVYIGYGNGAFLQLVALSRSSSWQRALNAPAGAAYAVRLVTAGEGGTRTAQWIFYDGNLNETSRRPATGRPYDPRQRPWYRQAVETKGLVSVPPYVMATTGELGMTIAQAHEGDRGIVIGSDVILAELSKFLNVSGVTNAALTLVLAADDKVLIRSGPHDVDVTSLLDLKTPPGVSTVSTLRIAGRSYLVSQRSVDFQSLLMGSRIVLAAPLDELTSDAEWELWRDLAIAGAIVLVGIIVATLGARWITVSLRQLTAEAERLKDLVLVTPSQVKSRVTEISALGRAMTAARTAINGFGLYVPVEIVKRILEDGRFVGRSASRQEVTAVFTDIEGFTTISEQTSPEEVVAMLSAYFDLVHRVVLANRGALIQFLGDSVFALWNAPLADPDHAASACRCALALSEEIRVYNVEREAQGQPPLNTRIGVHTGLAVVGSVGAETRLQYTAIGDTINLASRLEGINKSYGTWILVSEATALRCGGSFVLRKVDTLQAKGRSEPVTVFELLAEHPAHSTAAGTTREPAGNATIGS